jgi:hypothetical protein
VSNQQSTTQGISYCCTQPLRLIPQSPSAPAKLKPRKMIAGLFDFIPLGYPKSWGKTFNG